MKWIESRVLWGSLLIVGGILFLLQNLGIFRFGDLFWGAALGLGGLFFMSWFVRDRSHWWALIPGMALLSVATLIVVSLFAPDLMDKVGGGIVLGGIGLSFWLIYIVDRQQWWALIPGGVLLTLTAIVVSDGFFSGVDTAGLLFLGMGLTFSLVALLPGRQGEMRWAWIPAGILLVMGFLFMAAAGEMLAYLWPLMLILAGVFMLVRSFRRG